MGLKYAIFHWSFHLLFVIIIYFLFRLDLFNLFLIILATGLVDADHVFRIKKYGLIKWVKDSMEFHLPRKYPLHNFLVLFICLLASLLIFYNFSLGICLLSATLHLLWDFFEDITIFKMGVKHWRIEKWI